MSTGTAAPANVTIHDFRRGLEWAVQDVFSTMFSQKATVVASEDLSDVSGLSAIVGFGGKVSGFLALNMSAEAACTIAQGLLGMEFECVDDTVCDAVGELVNMLAGGLKKNLSRSEELFKLSIPSIINGQEYRAHAPSDAVKMMMGVDTGVSQFRVRLVVELK